MRRPATALLLVAVVSGCTGDALGLDGEARIQDTVGPDQMNPHVVTAEGSGALLVELSWNNRNIDLDLHITEADCESDPLTSCTVLAQSKRILSTRENTGLNVTAGQQYKLWVENLEPDRTVAYGLDYEVSS